MPFSKPTGKKQTPMPGPNSALYKKVIAARKVSVAAKPVAKAKAAGKRRQVSAAFSTLKSRQMIVERIKRDIWAKVLEINEAIIALALCGNYTAAKALFDFAGVYTLPMPDDRAASASVPAPVSDAAAEAVLPSPVDLFFRSLGVEPPCDEPEPELPVGSAYAAL